MRKGIPTYTQHSVAWPNNPKRDRVVDDVHVSFFAKGGGTHGEFTFEWVEFLRQRWDGRSNSERDLRFPYGALRVKVFTDGLPAFLDQRIQSVLLRLSRLDEDSRDVSPKTLIEMLEDEGVRPSWYHLQGLINAGAYETYRERARFEKEIARQRKREEAA